MTDLVDVRTAWGKVLRHKDIVAYSKRIYDYDIAQTVAISQGNDAAFMDRGIINFIQFVFSKSQELNLMCEGTETFSVTVDFYKEAIGSAEYHAVTDFFNTLFELVYTELATTWSGTIDFYESEDVEIRTEEMNGKPIWIGSIVYSGTKTVSLDF